MHRTWYKQGQALLEEIHATQPAPGSIALWYIGQCGFVFKSREATVYIDAVLNDMLDAQGNTRRWYPAPFDPALVQADYVLCTHGHRDHMALPTLVPMAQSCPTAKFIVPGAAPPRWWRQASPPTG